MPCDNPLLAEYVGSGEPLKIYGSLDRFLTLYSSKPMVPWLLLPCGKCLSCRMMQARMWSVRCAYEAKMHDSNCFLTLTYNDEHLPENGSLCRDDYQRFIKRLRKYLDGHKIRYFGCGEYGSLNLRPHYHFIIFGWFPPDAVPFFVSGSNVVYRSALLDSLWRDPDKQPIGFASVGFVSEDSIKYVCRYTLKKLEQKLPDGVLPSFTVASSRPAVGLDFFRRFWTDSVVKSEDGDILRYGFPDPFNSGRFLDVRFFRKKLLECEFVEKSVLNGFFAGRSVKLDKDEIERRCRFSEVRSSHNTHYGRILDGSQIEEIERCM